MNPTTIKIKLKVIPKSSRNAIVGWIGDRLKVCVTAAPEKGKANAAVEKLIAKALHLTCKGPKPNVRVVAGLTSPLKEVEIKSKENFMRATRMFDTLKSDISTIGL